MTSEGNVLLRVQQLGIDYRAATGAPVPAINNVSFCLDRGESLGVIGASGSGKSTLAMAVADLLPPHSTHWHAGSAIYLDGRDMRTVRPARRRRVCGAAMGVVFQEPMTALNPFLTIGYQVAECVPPSVPARRPYVLELLARVELTDPARIARAWPHMLSGGERQRVLIAMALASQPQLLIADEPTTALDVTVQQQILELLQRLQREDHLAILFISHDMGVVRAMTERILVMDAGQIVDTLATETLQQDATHATSKALLRASVAATNRRARVAGSAAPAAPILSAQALSVRYARRQRAVIRGLSLTLRRGATLGIVGESGAGKSTIAKALVGLVSYEGRVRWRGTDLQLMARADRRAYARDTQLVFQDPHSSLSPRLTLGDTIAEGLLAHKLHPHKTCRRLVLQALEDVGLGTGYAHRYPHECSGGQRQRVALARALVMRPSVVILDEPTSALDAAVQGKILALLRQLQHKYAMSYLIISHDLDVVRALADEVIVVAAGGVVEQGATEAIYEQPQQPYTRQLLRAAHRYKYVSAD